MSLSPDTTLTHPLWPYKDEKKIFCSECGVEIEGWEFEEIQGCIICSKCSQYVNNE